MSSKALKIKKDIDVDDDSLEKFVAIVAIS